MDVTNAINKVVKRDLIAVFDPITANHLLIDKAKDNDISLIGMSKNDYIKLIKLICEDKRLIRFWGLNRINDKIEEWTNKVD